MRTPGYGRWASSLAADDVARAKISLSELCSDGEALYWLESRPAEGGRVVLVRSGHDGPIDHSPADVSIRSRVHEYGGGAMCLVPGHRPGAFAYVDQVEQRVWLCEGPASSPRPLSLPTPAGERHHHGGLSATADGDWVLAVREEHRASAAAPNRRVVALSTRQPGLEACTLLEGHDFFGAPRVDPAGERLAVVVWDHPDMPWDASRLVVVPLRQASSAGDAGARLQPAGAGWCAAGGRAESVGQPAWAADGTLRFVSDRRGWWQPYRHPGQPGPDAPMLLNDRAAEFHGPDWVLGQSTMVELSAGTVVARATSSGRDALVTFAAAPSGEPGPGTVQTQPCVAISALCAHGEGVALIGSTPDAPASVWEWRPEEGARPRRRLPPIPLGSEDVATGEPFAATGRGGRPVHGTLYRPARRDTRGPADRTPPLLTWCHGGPTGACPPGLDLTVQFFTTRGFAVACVDYAGSSGYGRAYRCALWGAWGVADAEDCLDAALYLAARGDVDGQRMAVRGTSAGGMTALNALAAGEGFAAAAAWYGVTDLMALASTTHDFEAHYSDRLIGPLPGARPLYEARSPVNRAASMQGAVLLLQGTEDPIVPPAQAESMRVALDAAGVVCQLRYFDGEGHGFRRADTLAACLEAELAFYREHLLL